LRAVVQRVSGGKVLVENEVLAEIEQGLVVLLGISERDEDRDASYVAEKIANLRIFSDEDGLFNFSVRDIGGEVLVISQFTLFGDIRKGRRPSFTEAASPEKAEIFYKKVLENLREKKVTTKEGKFQAVMEVHIVNQGPVTIVIDSKKNF